MATPKSVTIHTVTARETGAKISIVQLGKPDGDNKWAAQCEHGAQTLVKTRRAAHEAGRTPKTWCATCKKGAPKAAPVPAKKAAAKKVTVPGPVVKRAAAKKTVAAK